jgi:hypothetical protein
MTPSALLLSRSLLSPSPPAPLFLGTHTHMALCIVRPPHAHATGSGSGDGEGRGGREPSRLARAGWGSSLWWLLVLIRCAWCACACPLCVCSFLPSGFAAAAGECGVRRKQGAGRRQRRAEKQRREGRGAEERGGGAGRQAQGCVPHSSRFVCVCACLLCCLLLR